MSFESELKTRTPSEDDIKRSQEHTRLESLTQLANAEIQHFKKACEEAAKKGNHNCSNLTFSWINYGVTSNDFYGEDNLYVGIENGGDLHINGQISPDDAVVFNQLLKDALIIFDFQNATIHKHPIYLTRNSYKRTQGLFKTKVKSTQFKELVAEKFCISTRW